MHRLKSDILAIFQKLADWLDWPCPVSAAHQNRIFYLLYMYFNFYLNLFFYEAIVRSSTLSYGHSDQIPGSVMIQRVLNSLVLSG